jgi:flagellar basal-body rod protein FlgB
MNLADIPLFSMLRGRLGHLNEREKIIAQNVANTDTAGYVPEDLQTFSFSAKVQQQRLQMNAAGGTMATTQAGHMASRNPRPAGGAFKTIKTPDSEMTLNGNSVVLEDEMIKMNDARMQYDAAISFYQKSLGLLKMAVRAPGRG